MARKSRNYLCVIALLTVTVSAVTLQGQKAAIYSAEVSEPVKPLPFTKEELLSSQVRDTYTGQMLEMIAIPLGGIGAGCVSMSGTGRLVDWEIFGNPNKGYLPHYTGFTLWTQAEGDEKSHFRVLAGRSHERLDGPYYLTPNMWQEGNGIGVQQTTFHSLPHMTDVKSFWSRFPFAQVELADRDIPLKATVVAWSPFIPGNSRDSSLPVAMLKVILHNPTDKKVQTSLAYSMQNNAGTLNQVLREKDFYCLLQGGADAGDNAMFIATAEPVTQWTTNWRGGHFFMTLEHFARTFCDRGLLDESAPPVERATPVEASKLRPDILFEDFEQGYKNWTITGEAFSSEGKPYDHYNPLKNYRGNRLADSMNAEDNKQGDAEQGKLTSKPFTIERPYVSFLIGGGNHPGRTCLNVLVDGKVVATQTGNNSEELSAALLNLSSYIGKQGIITIVDSESGGWGHVLVDDIKFTDKSLFRPSVAGTPRSTTDEGAKVGSIGMRFILGPGETKEIPFVLGWYFPNCNEGRKCYYATQWKSGEEVARYAVSHASEFEKKSRKFQESFFSSTLPGVVKEAISANFNVLRSPTMIRFANGTLYGWEGCAINGRLGHGTCNHVWNYQQTIPYLFPDLQRSMLEDTYTRGLGKDGSILFRLSSNPAEKQDINAIAFTAADGQMGQISQVYRDWQIYGDDNWLKSIWPHVQKALEYAWVDWDKDKDGLLEGSHHNTLDLNFSSAEPMCGSQYLAALLAGEKMAAYLGDEASAREYRRVFELGKRNSDAKLFNGEYYHQLLPAEGMYQVGQGCISEQIHGQLYAWMNGLESVYDAKNIQTAARYLFKYNYVDDFTDFVNTCRVFSTQGDRGLLIATWPKGGRPDYPVLYCDETVAGFEYQVAGSLLYSEAVLEGLTVIKSIRDRYDGQRRNPFCEFEWGNHYARSMASYNALLALSGWRYSGVEKMMTWKPQVSREDFRCFYAVEGGWGTVDQQETSDSLTASVSVDSGAVNLQSLILYPTRKVNAASVTLGNQTFPAAVTPISGSRSSGVTVRFADNVEIPQGQTLHVNLN